MTRLAFCPVCHRRVEARVVAVVADETADDVTWEQVRCARGGHLFLVNRFP